MAGAMGSLLRSPIQNGLLRNSVAGRRPAVMGLGPACRAMTAPSQRVGYRANGMVLRPAVAETPLRFGRPIRVSHAKRDGPALPTAAAMTTVANDAGETYVEWRNGGGRVHIEASVDESVVVEVSAVVHEGASIGRDCRIGAGTVVGKDVSICDRTVVWYNCSLTNCTVGSDCIIHNGVCLGQDGFGFFVDETTGQVVKKPQELMVHIGNDVEIGANSCVDRGSWRDTVVGDGCKIDNMVQIGHNVVMGNNCFLCGHVACGGSSTLGDYVVMGGKSAVADHISICSMVRVAGKSGVTHNLTEKGDYAGFPAVPAKEWRKEVVALRKLTVALKDLLPRMPQ